MNTLSHDPLVLMDRDKDGVIDPGTSMTVSAEDWATLGFGQGENYVGYIFD